MKKFITALLLALPLCVISCSITEQSNDQDNEISKLLVGNRWVLAFERNGNSEGFDFNFWGDCIFDFTSSNTVKVASPSNSVHYYDGYPMRDGLFCCNENDFIWNEKSNEYNLEGNSENWVLSINYGPYDGEVYNLQILDENTIYLGGNKFLIRLNGFDPNHLNRINVDDKTEYIITEKRQTQEIFFRANFQFEVQIDPSCSDWISCIETIDTSDGDFPVYSGHSFTTFLDIANNTGKERIGKIIIGKGDVFCEITIIQTRSVPDPEPNQIIYKTIDGSKIDLNIYSKDSFFYSGFPYLPDSHKIVSNEYENGYGTLTFEKELTYIPAKAFELHRELLSIKLPEKVSGIGDYAFGECECLADIVLPKDLLTIAGGAFYNCNSLKEVVFPESNSLTLYECSFYECYNLRTLYFKSVVPPTVNGGAFRGTYIRTIYVPNAFIDNYMAKVNEVYDSHGNVNWWYINSDIIKGYDY